MRVFMCYARRDRERVRGVQRALVDAGHQGWFDAFILPGDDWPARLREEIQVCDVFLYCVSSASAASEWCTWELAQAVLVGKPVVPAVLEGETSLPQEIAHLQFADLTAAAGEDDLRRLLGGMAALCTATFAPDVRDVPLGVPAHVAWRNPTTVRQPPTERIVEDVRAGVDPIDVNRRAADGPYIGIDFGTVTSLVAVLEDGRPRIIPNRAGQPATPSAVAVGPDGAVVVGEAARSLALVFPDRAELYPKRLLGTNRRLHVDGVAYSGARLASYVLRRLREDASDHLGQSVGAAVITAPTSFGAAELADLHEAAHLADLPVLRTIVEPTAACLAWGLGLSDEDRTVVVYDLGGGTFDVSVLEVGDGVFEVKSVVGDAHLGGRDYDRAVSEYCVAEFLAATGIDLSADPVALMRIRDACESTKVALSTAEQATVTVPFIHGDARGAYNLAVPVSRDKFEDLTFHLTDATIDACRDALADCNLRGEDPDDLLLVGLATRTPMVRDSVERCFSRRARRDIEPDAVVACGAAVQAGVLAGLVKELLLLDVRAHDLSVEVSPGEAVTVVPAHTTIPTLRRHRFTTTNTDAAVTVRVLEHAARRIPVAELVLDGIPTGARFRPLIEVDADIDANGDLHVAARVLGTDIERSTDAEVQARHAALPDALPVPLPPPRLATIIGLSGSGDLDQLAASVKAIQRRQPHVSVELEEASYGEPSAVRLEMYEGDPSTVRSAVDAVTAEVERAIRQAGYEVSDVTFSPDTRY